MRRTLITTAMLTSLVLAGCGGSGNVAPDDAAGGPPVAGMCLPEAPDCVDTVVEPGGEVEAGGDEFSADQAEAAAEALLGTAEVDLAADVRVARRGEESFFLTEDYRLGRMTVELDEHDGAFVVTAVTVELPDGPVTFTR